MGHSAPLIPSNNKKLTRAQRFRGKISTISETFCDCWIKISINAPISPFETEQQHQNVKMTAPLSVEAINFNIIAEENVAEMDQREKIISEQAHNETDD